MAGSPTDRRLDPIRDMEGILHEVPKLRVSIRHRNKVGMDKAIRANVLMRMFKILDLLLVLFRRSKCFKGAEVFSFAGLLVDRLRIDSIAPRF